MQTFDHESGALTNKLPLCILINKHVMAGVACLFISMCWGNSEVWFHPKCCVWQCHVSIIPIYSCMEKRNLKEFSKTVSLAMVLCVLTYTVTAALGYLMFGDKITSDILLSFEPDVPTLIAVILIAVKTYTTYPILLFCGRFVLTWD